MVALFPQEATGPMEATRRLRARTLWYFIRTGTDRVRVDDAADNIAAHGDGMGEHVNSEACLHSRVDRVAFRIRLKTSLTAHM